MVGIEARRGAARVVNAVTVPPTGPGTRRVCMTGTVRRAGTDWFRPAGR